MENKRKLSTDPRFKLNAVCPYFTMFPLEFPMGILRNSPKGLVVLDPFCGRGTTNYAAKYCGHKSFGIDASPVAVAISRAKVADTNLEDVMALVDRLLQDSSNDCVPEGDFWGWAYHRTTLNQICRLRYGLNQVEESDCTSMLKGIILGCLHGPLAKNIENNSYFSNQMPRTFSSKPNYSVNFWKKRELHPPLIDVRKTILKKGEGIFSALKKRNSIKSIIWHGDSCKKSTFDLIPDRVNLVITSPPYYGMTTYVQDQWLRNWFLGGPDHLCYEKKEEISHFSPKHFSASLGRVWANIAEIAGNDLKMVVRFGALPSRKADPDTILKESLLLSGVKWKLYRTKDIGDATLGYRQALTMGERSASQATIEKDYFIRIDN